jgi:NAD-dependent SIR2 family protein deacetylase
MRLNDRISKLEAGVPAPPACQTCVKPQIVLYEEPKPSGICPSCGQQWSTIIVPNEETRELTKRLIAGERTK